MLGDGPPVLAGQVADQERYEIQILESHDVTTPATNDAIYLKKAPDVNAAATPCTWQTYDTAGARVTVRWNGRLVHDGVAIDGSTGAGRPEDPAPGAIRLQDHGDPGDNPRFRNVWIERLEQGHPPHGLTSCTASVRRSSRLRILPLALSGISSTTRTSSGTL